MNSQSDVKSILFNKLNFNNKSLEIIDYFCKKLINFNKNHNLISKGSEDSIWIRHILDSAQLTRFIDFKSSSTLSDLGSGAGFPGIILAIFNNNQDFHVKLYDKSPVKCKFLRKIVSECKINAEVVNLDIEKTIITSEIFVCRAFKKLPRIIDISRENAKNLKKIIILKGKNAQEELKNTSMPDKYHYRLEDSMTDKDSKIIIIDIK